MASSSSSSSSSSGGLMALPATFLPTGGKKTPHHCSACKRETTLHLRIRCAECANFELCGDCFASGVTRHPHENTHSYRVVDCLDVPLFTKDWTANEELLLLEGIDKCGAGNWKTIAEYLGTGKTARQVEEHYWEGYMGRHGYCLPTATITVPEMDNETAPTETLVPAEGPTDADGYPVDPKDFYRVPVVPGYVRGEAVVRDFRGTSSGGGPAPAPTGGRGRPAAAAEAPAPKPGTDLPGYMTLREDFDVEHENDAENLLADMEFQPDDHPSERELKLQVIRIYNSKLDDRERRKRFVIDRGLVDRKEQVAQDRRRSKEERDIVARLRVFARFHSAADHEALVRLIKHPPHPPFLFLE
jgi:transcriptional adapter 2-alpha